MQGSSRGPDGDTEADARIGKLLESLQPSRELPAKRAPDHHGRDMKLADEDLSVKPLGSQRSKKRALDEILVGRRLASQDFGQRGSRRVELHRHDQTARDVNAVGAAPILDELQGPGGFAPVQDAEEVA
jgi:hypothetical protein